LVEPGQALLAGPVAHRVADAVAEVGREPAALELEHRVPAPGNVQPERRPFVGLRERVLHLVAVVEDLRGADDRLERRVCDAGDARQRVTDPRVLRRELRLVGEILEAAAAAGRVVPTRVLDADGPRFDHFRGDRLRVTALYLRDPRAHLVAGQSAPDEDDEAVEARDAVAAVGERVDLELELL